MTLFEAIDAVEKAMTRLELRDTFGDSVTGIEAVGWLNQYFADEISVLENAIEEDRITPLGYFDGMIKIIYKAKEIQVDRRARA